MLRVVLIGWLIVAFLSPCDAQVDSAIGTTAPDEVSRDHQALTHYLCSGLIRDRDKANAIYNWITHNISYDIQSFRRGDVRHPKVEQVLKTRTTMCEGYSMLFTTMCREAGLKAVIIDGYARDWMFDNGDKLYIPRHEWCGVLIDGNWELVDPTWGAGGITQAPGALRRILNKLTRQKALYAKRLKFEFRYDPRYFLQDPGEFKVRHLPADPMWQLADTVMPINIFEQGDSAVNSFNNRYCKNRKSSTDLDRIATLTEEQKNFELADRAYAYNSRYPLVQAVKNTYKANTAMEKALTDSTVSDGNVLVSDALNSLKRSEAYIKEQKKAFPGEYSELRKKNEIKNQLARREVQRIKAEDRKLIAESRKFIRNASTRIDKLNWKAGEVKKRERGADPGNFDEVEPARFPKKPGSPEVRVLEDSLAAWNNRITELDGLIASLSEQLINAEAANRKRLDMLAADIDLSDSMLELQTRSRLGMNDNYDDEVIAFSTRFSEYKYGRVDTLQRNYMATFDVIGTMHDRKQKQQLAQMDLYKKSILAMEQMKRWSVDRPGLVRDYKTCVGNYLAALAIYDNDKETYIAYIRANRNLFEYLIKVNRKEIALAGYMEKAENMRKSLEDKTLVKKQQMDLDENERQLLAIRHIRTEIANIGSR